MDSAISLYALSSSSTNLASSSLSKSTSTTSSSPATTPPTTTSPRASPATASATPAALTSPSDPPPSTPPSSHLLPPQLPADHNLHDKNKKALQFIEDVMAADEVQRRVLAEILCRNARVEYVSRHGLNGQTDRESFKRTMPVITYEDLQPGVARISRAEVSDPLLSLHFGVPHQVQNMALFFSVLDFPSGRGPLFRGQMGKNEWFLLLVERLPGLC